MLIPDLLNTLFDQSDYPTLVKLCALNKRKTAYASKYSSLIGYDIFDKRIIKNIEYICETGKLRMMKHVRNNCSNNLLENALSYLLDNVLSFCAKHGHLEMVKYLFNNQTNIWAIRDALDDAVRYGHANVVKFIVCRNIGMLKEYIDILDASPSHGHLEIVKFVFEHGMHAHDFLPWAVMMNEMEIVMYLVDAGIDIHVGNEAPLDVAIGEGNLSMVKYLISVGANINAIDIDKCKVLIALGCEPLYRYLCKVKKLNNNL